MMKTKQLIISLTSLLFLFMGLASCVPSQDINELRKEGALKVEEDNLTFPKDGGNKSLSIQGVDKWTFITNVSETGWLKAKQTGNSLDITVIPNLNGEERKATIMIMSGRDNHKVLVTQSSADFVMEFSEPEIVFPSKGGSKLIQVKSNSSNWSFEPISEDVTWIKVVGGDSPEMIVIETTENMSYEDRDITLLASAANGEKRDLHIIQKGITKYYMPFEAEMHYSAIDLLLFENERGNILQNYTEPAKDPWGRETPGQVLFITNSDYMPLILYVQELTNPKYTVAQIPLVFQDPDNPKEVEEYVQLLLSNDYEEKPLDNVGTRIFFRKDQLMGVVLKIEARKAMVNFVPQYPQFEELPTFDQFPRGTDNVLKLLLQPEKKVQEVRDWEKAHNSELYYEKKDKDDESLYSNIMFSTNKTGKDEAQRGYYFSNKSDCEKLGISPDDYLQSVQEIDLVYTDINLAIRTVGKNVYLTKEFKQLALDNGYEQFKSEDGTFFFKKRIDEKRVEIFFVEYAKGYSNILDGRECLNTGFIILNMPEKEGTKMSFAVEQAKKGNLEYLGLTDFELIKKVNEYLRNRK